MKIQTDVTVLDHLLVVNLDVHIWSARRKLQPLDLGNADLPPEELASLGSKRICNPEELKNFATLKARATSLLERNGIRFLNGWAIPEAHMDEINNELSIIRDEFNQAKNAFLLRYEESVQEWIAKHPDWGDIIANSVVSEDYVRSRMDFRWQMFRVASPHETDPGAMRDNLTDDVRNLGGTLFEEIAKTATETWQRCYAGKTEITRKALSPLKSIYDKLMGLSFIEPRISPVAELIGTAFANIPRRGSITGGTLLMLQGLVALLRNPKDLVEHGQLILDGNRQAQDILHSFRETQLLPSWQEESSESSENAEDDEPHFDNIPSPPMLESYGLW